MEGLKQIVVGIDFSESSRTALEQAVRLSGLSGAALRAVHVIERSFIDQMVSSMENAPGDLETRVVSHARYGVERMVAEVADAKGVRVDVVVGSAATELAKASEEVGGGPGSLLVLGTLGQKHRKGVGTTAGRCVRHGPTDVLLVREEHKGAFQRVVACVDFSDTSVRALREAVRVARHDRAVVLALNVFSPPPPAYPPGDAMGLWPIPAPDYGDLTARLREAAAEALANAVASLGKDAEGVTIEQAVVEEFSYGRGICEFAKEKGADLVVIGTHGHTNLRYMLLGSTAEKVLREVHCSVLAVKPAMEQKR